MNKCVNNVTNLLNCITLSGIKKLIFTLWKFIHACPISFGRLLVSNHSKCCFMLHEKFQSCIEACNECATTCTHCATSCLHESDVKMLAHCIQLDLECAAICRSAAELMSLGSSHAQKLCAICADICDACAAECEKHSHMEHCKECAEACRRCAEECRSMSKQGVAVMHHS